MKIKSQIVANMYRDSIALMRLARDLFEREDVARAEVLMATPANLEVLGRAGLLADEIGDASPNDIIIAIEAESDKAADSSIEWAKEMLTTPRAGASAGEGHQHLQPAIRVGSNAGCQSGLIVDPRSLCEARGAARTGKRP